MVGFDGVRIFSRRWRWVRVIVLWGGFLFGVLLYVLFPFLVLVLVLDYIIVLTYAVWWPRRRGIGN